MEEVASLHETTSVLLPRGSTRCWAFVGVNLRRTEFRYHLGGRDQRSFAVIDHHVIDHHVIDHDHRTVWDDDKYLHKLDDILDHIHDGDAGRFVPCIITNNDSTGSLNPLHHISIRPGGQLFG